MGFCVFEFRHLCICMHTYLVKDIYVNAHGFWVALISTCLCLFMGCGSLSWIGCSNIFPVVCSRLFCVFDFRNLCKCKYICEC